MRRAIMLAIGSAAVLSACGPNGTNAAGDYAAGSNVVNITMTDMAYTPTEVKAPAGETITFVFKNEGSVRHEAVFGDLDEQLAHHDEMKEGSHGTMEMGSAPHDQMKMGSAPDHEMGSTGNHEMGSTAHGETAEMHSVVVEPGETVEVTHVFGTTTIVGCHEPGHWEAGMKLEVTV